MSSLIVNRLRAHHAACEARWEVSCPDGTIIPIGFWWSAMVPDDEIVQAARQAVKNASREGDAILDREVVMGSWIPVD